jgi:hypothetical protein
MVGVEGGKRRWSSSDILSRILNLSTCFFLFLERSILELPVVPSIKICFLYFVQFSSD